VSTVGRPVDRSRASGQDTRRRIIAAAESLFSARGFDNVTVRDIATAAGADPALVVRYFGSKNDLFLLVRQPDLHLPQPAGQQLTVRNLTRALVELSLDQGTRLFDVTTAGGAETSRRIKEQIETQLIGPVMDAFGLAPAARSHIEAIAALAAGLSFLRHRVQAPGLEPLSRDELTDLLTPAVRALLKTAPKNADHADET
jgi:AcrR family transcriptional regulator